MRAFRGRLPVMSRNRLTTPVLAAAGAAVLALAGNKLRRYVVADDSMRPALEDGEFVIGVRTRTADRGNIVTLPDPHQPDRTLIKRVVGLPGEIVEAAAGQLHVEGAVLAEPWADGPTLPDATWVVPDDSVLVLSDNRAATLADSRRFGPVERSTLEYRIVARYWPPSRAGRV